MIGFSPIGYVCAPFFYFAGPGISFPFAGMGPHESEGSRSPSPLNEVKRFFSLAQVIITSTRWLPNQIRLNFTDFSINVLACTNMSMQTHVCSPAEIVKSLPDHLFSAGVWKNIQLFRHDIFCADLALLDSTLIRVRIYYTASHLTETGPLYRPPQLSIRLMYLFLSEASLLFDLLERCYVLTLLYWEFF